MVRGLVSLASCFSTPEDQRRLLAPVRKFARREVALVAPLLRDVEVIDPREITHGRRAALVLHALPLSQDVSVGVVLRDSVPLVTAALRAGAWPAADLRSVLVVLRQQGTYNEELIAALIHYLRSHTKTATAGDVVHLVSMAALMPEVYRDRGSGVLDLVAERVALVADELTPTMVGTICGCLNRAQLCSGTVVLALQEEADRVAQSCDARAAVEFLLFVCRHEAKFISGDSVQWLLERVMGETLDATALLHLCRALRSLPLRLKEQLRTDLVDVIAFISSQMAELVKQERLSSLSSSLISESTQVLLTSFLGVHKVLVHAPEDSATLLQGYLTAVDSCATYVMDGLEGLDDGAESLSLGLVVALLEAPSQTARDCGARVLREFARECVSLPALQTFRFLLLLGDTGAGDAAVLRYLRRSFCTTAADVPPTQLCTALRCFAACGFTQHAPSGNGNGGGELRQAQQRPLKSERTDLCNEVEVEKEVEESAAFFRFTLEVVEKYFASGMSMRLALALVEALYHLGCRDESFLESAAAFLETRRATATPQTHSAEAAETVCLALGEDILDKYPHLHSFLLTVGREGTRGESQLKPSAWMDLHDPANALGALTEQQQEGWNTVEKMMATPAEDHNTLIALAESYLKLLPFIRPDDHKYFFAVCEEKVLKKDQLMRQCLSQLETSGITSKLSGATIGSILHSLAALRFAYPRATRRFLGGVTEEQWREMDALPLVTILSAMSRLSLCMPSQLDLIGQRVSALSRFLSPRDIAEAIRAFQCLSYQDEAVLQSLVNSAATRASGFDEASISSLFSAPAVHRLLRTPEVALPLLRRACGVVSSPQMRQRIAAKMRRSGVPRDLLESCTAELRILSGPGAREVLRLT